MVPFIPVKKRFRFELPNLQSQPNRRIRRLGSLWSQSFEDLNLKIQGHTHSMICGKNSVQTCYNYSHIITLLLIIRMFILLKDVTASNFLNSTSFYIVLDFFIVKSSFFRKAWGVHGFLFTGLGHSDLTKRHRCPTWTDENVLRGWRVGSDVPKPDPSRCIYGTFEKKVSKSDFFCFFGQRGWEDDMNSSEVWDVPRYEPGSKLVVLGMAIPPLIGNPYNGYINPYYWVDDHPLLYGNNGSLDPSTYGYFRRAIVILYRKNWRNFLILYLVFPVLQFTRSIPTWGTHQV